MMAEEDRADGFLGVVLIGSYFGGDGNGGGGRCVDGDKVRFSGWWIIWLVVLLVELVEEISATAVVMTGGAADNGDFAFSV